MKRMALSALVRQRGAELTNAHISVVEIANGKVSKIVDTFVIDMVFLVFSRYHSTLVRFATFQLVSEIASEIAFEGGAEAVDVEAMDLDVQAATTTITLADGTIWFTDIEEGENVHWCIHSPDHPLLPGHKARQA